MTTALMYDSAYPPSDEQALAFAAEGVHTWGAYVASPGAYHAWHPDDVQRLQRVGIQVLLIWVPATVAGGRDHGIREGAQAAGLVRQFYPGCPAVCLDMEAVMYDTASRSALEYSAGWAQSVDAAGLRAVAYGPFRYLLALNPAGWCGAWAAAYVELEPSGLPPYQLRDRFGATAWQWKNTHDVHGLGVDRSVCDPALVSGTTPAVEANQPMTGQEKTALAEWQAKVSYVALGHREPDPDGARNLTAAYASAWDNLDTTSPAAVLAGFCDHGGEIGADINADYTRDHPQGG